MTMNLRMAYRVESMPISTLPSMQSWCASMDSLGDLSPVRWEVKAIRDAPKFIFDNVAEYYASNHKSVWYMGTDFPNLAPPFPVFWAEWNEPTLWNYDGKVEDRSATAGQFGVLAVSNRVTPENIGHLDLWRAFCFGAFAQYSSTMLADDGLRTLLDKSYWVTGCSLWAAGPGPLGGRPLWLGGRKTMFVTRDGGYVETISAFPSEFRNDPEDGLMPVMHVLGLGLSFMHCKNVVQREQVDDRGERWHRRQKVSKITFKTLDINPMREVLRREGQSDTDGLQRALHICRGHFATYTEEHPLFGRYAGTFWRPDHVRGSKEAGEVVKNYNVSLGGG